MSAGPTRTVVCLFTWNNVSIRVTAGSYRGFLNVFGGDGISSSIVFIQSLSASCQHKFAVVKQCDGVKATDMIRFGVQQTIGCLGAERRDVSVFAITYFSSVHVLLWHPLFLFSVLTVWKTPVIYEYVHVLETVLGTLQLQSRHALLWLLIFHVNENN